MKGVILAGGTATRLFPITKALNKHMLPVGQHPMVYYPVNTMMECGITEILIVTGNHHAGQFVDLLGDGSDLGVNITYSYQKSALGIADALKRAEHFVGTDSQFLTILGDNIYTEPLDTATEFPSQAKIFLKEVAHPEHYGVVEMDKWGKIYRVTEKPKHPVSSLIATGAYLYPMSVFSLISRLSPSERGELEITDINNMFINANTMDYQILKTDWYDCGESLTEYNETSYKMKDVSLYWNV